MTIHNLKGGVGPFKIFHVGNMTYTVERDGKVLDTVEHISEAYRSAGRLNDRNAHVAEPFRSILNAASPNVPPTVDHDDDMFDGDEREDRQAARFDHARDLRKHEG